MEVFEEQKVSIQKNYVLKILTSLKKDVTLKSFKLWKNYVFFSKMTRSAVENFSQIERQRNTRQAIKLLSQRAKMTEKYRLLIDRFR